MDPHGQASHYISPRGSGGEDAASTEAAVTQEIAELPSNVDPLPPAFDEHTQTSPPQAPPAPSFNSIIIDEVREGHHCLSGAERVSAALTRAQNNILGDESLSNAPTTPSLLPTPPDDIHAYIIETDFCDWMHEQREALASSQENLPREQLFGSGSISSLAPIHGHPSEEELCGMCRSKSTISATKYVRAA